MNDEGWRPLRPPKRSDGREGTRLVATPFVRLARVHAATTASDAALAVALAGSIFFSISPDAARWRVALYLLLTMAPFAIVTPLIGPAIDRIRGGRRAMIIATTMGRLVVAFFMIRHIETLWLFPLAFALLVLQKGHAVAKSAVVPRYVQSESNLVDANSRLALIAAISSLLGAAIGGAFSLIGGSSWAAAVGMIGYMGATFLAFQLPRVKVAAAPPAALEIVELRGATILLTASAMAVLRGAVGFVTFFLAFEFRGGEESLDVSADGAAVGGLTATARGVDITGDPAAPVWHFGMVILAAAGGTLLGARLAPQMRSRFSEETIVASALATVSASAVLAALFGGLPGAMLLSLSIATGAGAGKLAFDALVQRDAPDANHGRSFARFEARFQIAWVIGAFVPTALPLSTSVGSVVVAAAVGAALASYLLGRAGRPIRYPQLKRPVRFGRTRRESTPDQPEARTDSLASENPSLVDPTTDLGEEQLADETIQFAPSEPDHGGDRSTDLPPAPWWDNAAAPMVTSVEGVQVDEPGPRSSLPPIESPAESGPPAAGPEPPAASDPMDRDEPSDRGESDHPDGA